MCQMQTAPWGPRMHLYRAELKDPYVSSYCVRAIITPCSKLQMASVSYMVVVEWCGRIMSPRGLLV